MTGLEKKIYDIVRRIPEGSVATYGRIAELAGNRKLSRVVGNAMHKNPVPFLELARNVGYKDLPLDYDGDAFEPVPCHRVVNSTGKMGGNFGMGGPEIQEKMLMVEGVQVKDGKVDLKAFMKI